LWGLFDVAARLRAGDGPIAALVGGAHCSLGSALQHRTFNDYKNNSTVLTFNEHRRTKIRRRCPILSFLLVASVAMHRQPSLVTLRSARDDPSDGRRLAQIPQLDTPQASKESHNWIHIACALGPTKSRDKIAGVTSVLLFN